MAIQGLKLRIPTLNVPLSRLLGQVGTWWLKEFLAFFSERTAKWLIGSPQKVLIIAPGEAFAYIMLVGDARQILTTERVDTSAFSMVAIESFLHARGPD